MLRRRVASERAPRTKNGQPPQSTTGVASASWTSGCASRAAACAIPPGSISRHAEHEQRRRQDRAGHEAARHVRELRVRRVGGDAARLERHAADRAVAGPVAHDLGVHRAGPRRARHGAVAVSGPPSPALARVLAAARACPGRPPGRPRSAPCRRRSRSTRSRPRAASCASRSPSSRSSRRRGRGRSRVSWIHPSANLLTQCSPNAHQGARRPAQIVGHEGQDDPARADRGDEPVLPPDQVLALPAARAWRRSPATSTPDDEVDAPGRARRAAATSTTSPTWS